jgi:hypothetical protein
MYRFNKKIYKTLRTLMNAKRKRGGEIIEIIDEILKSKGTKKEKNDVISKMKKDLKKLNIDINKHDKEIKENQIIKRKTKYNENKFAKQNEGLNFLLFDNNKINKQTKKTHTQRINERFKDLNENQIREQVTIRRRREHYKALGNSFKEIFIIDNVNNKQLMKGLINQKLQKEFIESRRNNKSMSAHFEFKYSMVNNDGIEVDRYYRNYLQDIPVINVINGIIERFYEGLDDAILISNNNSQLVFGQIKEIIIRIVNRKRRTGGDYIELSEGVRKSNSTINIKNHDNRCLEYCIIASREYKNVSVNGKTNPNVYKKYFNNLNIPENQQYPINIDIDIIKYEELNKICINIYVIRDNLFYPEYKSEFKFEEKINLLLLEEDDKKHFVFIKSLSRIRNHLSNDKSHKKYDCDNCFAKSFKSQELLDEHLKLCLNNKRCKVELPKEGENNMKFIHENNEFKHPFDIQADFESTLLKVNKRDDEGKTEEEKSTYAYQKHIPNSFGLKYNCIHKKHSEALYLYNNKEPKIVIKKWVEELERLAKKSYDLLQINKTNIIMSDDEKNKHSLNINCENCKCEYDESNKKIKHHNHITGDFISSLCNKCNLKFQYKRFLPVYLHNLKGYDSHLFIRSLYEYGYQQEGKDIISCIPNNEERYISFSKQVKVDEYEDYKTKKMIPILFEIRFIDTFAFMASSIDSLTNNLKNGCNTTQELRNVFKNTSDEFKNDEEFNLMIQKGVYPYDYIDNYERLNENKLPKKKKFYSKLNYSECSNEDYERARIVWNKFNCKKLLDYHNLYLKSDVLLLADIWSNFREVCYKNYNLDCTYYYTAPSLSWDSMLKKTKINLELLTDIDMVNFVESGIRGGLSQISKRYAKANNKYMKEYDESKEDSFITYLDANNLYGGAMSEYLPYEKFKWNKEKWETNKILELNDKGDKGYLFDVDLHIPEKLHDYFNGYVPLPLNKSVKKNELNKWQQENYNESKVEKLCCTLDDRKDYVVNYRMLKLALSLGFELVKVNKVLEYNQKPFLKEYIDLNTNLRKKAKSDFEKDFYKLMNNSVFGKTMENVRNRIEFRLISNEGQVDRLTNKMNSFKIFDDNLVGVHMQKKSVKMNKPIYIGQNVLDDSKFTMMNFHYNFMKKKIKHSNLSLMFTDTDSLCYHINKQDIYEIMNNNKDEFDLSNYPKEHKLYDETNKKVVNKFKNESISEIKEFIGLRSKLYSFITDDDIEHKKCKGVKKIVVKKFIKHENYKNTLLTRENFNIKQNGIRSYNHQLYSETTKKIALSAFDDKVYICDDNINTFTHGHKKNKIKV